MFQVVIVPSGPTLMSTPTQITLYLQASVSISICASYI